MSKLKVNMLPLQAHCFAFGGFEIQMLELYNALNENSNLIMKKMNPWDRDAHFDILHLWGLEQSNFNNAYWAKQSGKKVVLTALIGQIEKISDAIRFNISKRIGNVRFLLQVLNNVDALVVVNELEAKKATDYFKLPKDKVFILPNVLTKEAVEVLKTEAVNETPFTEYLFCAGNISERKNQLILAKAAVETNTNMVFAGNFICSDSYKDAFLELIDSKSNLVYYGNLSNTSNQLFNLFRCSGGFCLPSYQETQPISVLEAALFGKNILIGNGAYSKQKMFKNLIKVDVRSIESIRQGITQLKSNDKKTKYSIDKEDLDKCFHYNVSDKYFSLYKSFFN